MPRFQDAFEGKNPLMDPAPRPVRMRGHTTDELSPRAASVRHRGELASIQVRAATRHVLDAREFVAEMVRRLEAVRTSAPQGNGASGLVASLGLWFVGGSAPAAARRALSALDEHLDPRCRDDLQLLVTELVSNGVRHSMSRRAGAVGLEVRVGRDLVRVDVTDPGPGFEPPVALPVPGEGERSGGLGLVLVDAVALRWGVGRGSPTRVWFELPTRVAQPARGA
jgi:anti-sigma regulatory factor (Ser/Thr protein kinase)